MNQKHVDIVVATLRDAGELSAAQVCDRTSLWTGEVFPILFRLESDKTVTSRWAAQMHYPRRRLYRLADDPVETVPPDAVGGMTQALLALMTAEEQFLEYARQHDAKGTPESAVKANVNREMAAMCAAAIKGATQ